jgi:hypothetical protein
MGGVKVDKFGGMLPAWDARFIPEDQASLSRNTYLYSGACIGWRQPKLLRNLTNSAAKMAYRIPTITQGIASDILTVTGPIAGDTVTLGEITYKFTATPTNPYDVLLGSTPTKSAQALFQTINFGSSDVNVAGKYTPANPAVTGDNPYVGYPFALQGTTNTPGANELVLIPVTPTSTMVLNSINCMPEATVGNAKFKGVIYDNINTLNTSGTAYINIPSSLLGTGTEIVGCTSGVAVTSALATPPTLQAGFTYWVGFIMDTAVPLQLSSNGTTGVSQANTYTAGPPNPFQSLVISGSTTFGTSVGTLQSRYNLNQPNWQIWGATVTINTNDPLNTITGTVINLQAPAFGTAYNKTPVSESTGGVRLSWASGVFTGGANQTSDTTITGASIWLEFLDQDTDVLRTPVVDDTFQRYYFASPSVPPQYNTYNRITQGLPAFYLGVPAPPIAPILSINGGGTSTQIGFPNSTTGNTFQVPTGNPSIFLYPVSTTQPVVLNDISFSLAQCPAVTMSFYGILGSTTSDGKSAGDIIEIGNLVNGTGPFTSPQTLLSSFSVPPTLLPFTQYWIGVVVLGPSGVTPSGVQFSLADTNTQGYSGTLTASGGFVVYPIDPKTGAQEAPTMTANFQDLQLWGDLSPANQIQTSPAIQETRAYVYTWVTAYGEEGPPSPPALLTGFNNATWTIGLQPPLTQDMGTLRNIVKTNIYRTMASVQGGTSFFLVDSVAATATTYNDSFTDDIVSGNLILPSTTWFGPPTTLQGIVAMPNGMMAGFVGNEVWFCEPYRPHAWPSQYTVTTDYPIIGLGVVGSTLVAATTFNPQTFTGTNPASITQVRIPLPEPCIARRSVLSTDSGVYYASANGLIKVSGAGIAQNTTQNWITRDLWDQLTPQKFIRAVKNVSAYFAFGTTGVTNGQPDNSVAQKGYTLELSEVADRSSFSLWPQVGGHRIGFNPLTSPVGLNIDNVLSDPWSGVTFLVAGGSLYQYDFTDPLPTITPFLWRSKKFQGPHKENFAAFRVWFDIPPGGPQSPPPTRTTVPFQEHPGTTAQLTFVPGMFGIVRVIADGLYITERELRTSEELMRVAAAQKYTTWQLEFEGVVSITNAKLATTVKELGLMK